MKLAICTPTVTRPHEAYLASVEAAASALDAAGIEHQTVFEVGCPYISHARANMLRKALDAGCDTFVFIDHDVEFRPRDLVSLVRADGDVVAGLYRFKKDEEEYMGVLNTDAQGYPRAREDGCLRADKVPAGFLKVTLRGVRRFMRAYPELVFGNPEAPAVDLFNHGAHEGVWYGEDYAFSRRWRALDEIWVVPDLDLNHHSSDKAYLGNFHRFMLRQPGGSEFAPPPQSVVSLSPPVVDTAEDGGAPIQRTA